MLGENRVICIPPGIPCLDRGDAPPFVLANEAFAHHYQDFQRQVIDFCRDAIYDRKGRRAEYRALLAWARSKGIKNCGVTEYDLAQMILAIHEEFHSIHGKHFPSQGSTYEETTIAGLRVRVQHYGTLHINGECLTCFEEGLAWTTLYHKTEEALFEALRKHAEKEHRTKAKKEG